MTAIYSGFEVQKQAFDHHIWYKTYLHHKSITEQERLGFLLVKHAGEERWREVILIAVGLVKPHKRAEELINVLLIQSSANAANLALVGRSLAEDIQISQNLRSSIRRKLLEQMELTESSSDFSLLSGALLDTDSSAMQNWIGTILSGHNLNLQKRVLTSLIPDLGLEQSKPFLPTLTKVLADSHAEINLRIQCALTLAKIKPSPDSELWNVVNSARGQKDLDLKSAAIWATCELGHCADLGLIMIPAGEFLMGSSDIDNLANDDEKPQHTVYLPNYYIAKYPVTVDAYHAFIQESGYKNPDGRTRKGMGAHPVSHVTWNDALVFARWNGLTLPSEAEWEKAARGVDGRIYPWGNEWQNGFANTAENWRMHALLKKLDIFREGEGSTTTVGSFPQGNSPYGCADMSGNVWEWTRSVYQGYPYNVNDGRENANTSSRRMLRGGSFLHNQESARCAIRLVFNNNFLNGFRVAASPNLS